MNLPKILVTGFGPFPGAPENPSALVALSLARSKRAGRYARVKAKVLPTVYAKISVLLRLIEKEKPDAVLMFGLAGRARGLKIETRGKNRASLLHVDAAGVKAARTLISGAPKTLRTTAPVRALLRAARGAGADARLSSDAGSYVCNAAIFHALYAARGKTAPLIAFVHIPWPRGRARSHAGRISTPPTMATIKRAGEAMLIALARALV